jgi:hypothetical protein
MPDFDPLLNEYTQPDDPSEMIVQAINKANTDIVTAINAKFV